MPPTFSQSQSCRTSTWSAPSRRANPDSDVDGPVPLWNVSSSADMKLNAAGVVFCTEDGTTTLRFVSPLRRDGAGQELLGGFTVERSGSGETLDRGVYDFRAPYAVTFFASLRLVVDLGDPEKIEAVLAGGVNERHFQPHQNDQAKLWADGGRQPWWFDPKQIEAHARSRLTLTP